MKMKNSHLRDLFLIFFIFLPVFNAENKYSDIASIRDKEKPFRINKLNSLWEKAKKYIAGPKIADLYAELVIHDQKERQLKKLKSEDLDKDGLKEAEVQQRFLNIIDKYGLIDHYGYGSEKDNEIPHLQDDIKISDRKLKKIWNQAQLGNFEDDELVKLKEEFWHQQMKIDEFDILKNEIDAFDNTEIYDRDSAKNQLTKNKQMKEKYKDMRDGYDKLKHIAEKASSDMDDFKDHRVYELWALAKNANFTDVELKWFKDELKHFEHRLNKHEYLREQLKMTEDVYRAQYKKGNYPEKYTKMAEQVKDYEWKVKKIHADLEKRINKAYAKHTEL